MSLANAIAEALATSNPPPPSEAATRRWIIDPLLDAAGYRRTDIIPEVTDAAGRTVDYAILPDTPACWFLEAKAWNVPLQDAHAVQAYGYANAHGKRWAVLTNGREWRLYDDSILGSPADKLAACATLDDLESIEPLLDALSKESVVGAGLETYGTQRRLERHLADQLSNPESETVRLIWSKVKARPGLGTVTRTQVVAILGRTPRHELPPAVTGAARRDVLQVDASGSEENLSNASRTISLADLRMNMYSAANTVPVSLRLPDGSEPAVQSWRDVQRQLVQWLAERHVLPTPFLGLSSGYRYFLNNVPEWMDRPMPAPTEIRTPNQTVYADLTRNAQGAVACLAALCRDLGVSAADIKLTLRPYAPSYG